MEKKTSTGLAALVGVPQFLSPPEKQRREDLMEQARDLMDRIMTMHGVEDDSDGLALSAVREASTGRILSVHLTPVDMVDGEAVPRYVTAQEVASH